MRTVKQECIHVVVVVATSVWNSTCDSRINCYCPHAVPCCAVLCCVQAFEVVTRPALDSAEAALDRVKMLIYTQFAKYGLPCPITGHSSSDRAATTTAAAASQ